MSIFSVSYFTAATTYAELGNITQLTVTRRLSVTGSRRSTSQAIHGSKGEYQNVDQIE
jgi:hypothetical protein